MGDSWASQFSRGAATLPPGVGEDLNYTYSQDIAATTWGPITHALGKFPSVTVIDSSGNVVYGDILHIDTNTLSISFTAAFSGKAYLN